MVRVDVQNDIRCKFRRWFEAGAKASTAGRPKKSDAAVQKPKLDATAVAKLRTAILAEVRAILDDELEQAVTERPGASKASEKKRLASNFFSQLDATTQDTISDFSRSVRTGEVTDAATRYLEVAHDLGVSNALAGAVVGGGSSSGSGGGGELHRPVALDSAIDSKPSDVPGIGSDRDDGSGDGHAAAASVEEVSAQETQKSFQRLLNLISVLIVFLRAGC